VLKSRQRETGSRPGGVNLALMHHHEKLPDRGVMPAGSSLQRFISFWHVHRGFTTFL
jgi:hypothetical protein